MRRGRGRVETMVEYILSVVRARGVERRSASRGSATTTPAGAALRASAIDASSAASSKKMYNLSKPSHTCQRTHETMRPETSFIVEQTAARPSAAMSAAESCFDRSCTAGAGGLAGAAGSGGAGGCGRAAGRLGGCSSSDESLKSSHLL